MKIAERIGLGWGAVNPALKPCEDGGAAALQPMRF